MVRDKGMIRRIVCAGFFLLLLQVPSVRSTAQLWLQLQTFQNGGPYKYDGSCCDGEAVGRNCTGSCDYSVSICLSSRGKNGTCDLGRSNVGSLDEQGDNFVFPNSFLNGASNPVLLSLPVWGGELHVQVSISDVDTAMEELVDSFNFEFSFEQPVRDRRLVGTDFQGFKLIGTRAREASRLDVALAVRCDTFYYDRNCSTNCVPANDCTGHYECDRVTGAKICLNGWRGVDCNEATGDICGGNNPCENGATCTRYGQYNNNTLCCCARGFTGPTCAQDVDECLSQPCLNGGQCVQGLPNSFSCLCNPRYKGETCSELRTCAENPCMNGGSCFPVASTFFCSCSPRYTGVVCETDTLPPETTTPAPTCPPGYFGPGCSVRCEERDDCGGHYTCDTNTGARRCRTGWQGENCTRAVLQDPLCPCQNGGQCFQGACCCPAGFSGSRCQNRAQQDFCSSQPCRNGGFCINDFDFDRFLCLCPQKYKGRECELLASGRPVCPPDYYGPRCDVFCRSGDDCLAGQWDCDPDTGARVCRFGWTGPNCDVRDPFALHQTPCPNSVCLNGGICTNNTCCCSPGWTGSLCHIEIVECASNPCLNGACVDLVNDYRCECEVGWAGRQCDIQLPEPLVTRAPNPCDNSPCRNGATCVEGLPGTGVVCLCPDGYRGRLCEEMEAVTAQPPSAPGCPAFTYGPQCSVTCRDRNDCQGHYYCDPRTGQQVCRNGWGGAGCGERLVEPLSDPECALPGLGCLNGGTCFRGGCCCPQGFTGQLCQDRLLPCSSRPCLNGASCLDVEGGYRCACAPGWEGSVCERFVGTPGGTPATSTPPAAYLTEIIYLRGDVNVITRYTQIQDILQSALLVNNPDDNMQIRIIASQIFMDANGTAIVGYTYRRSPGRVLIGGRDRYWDAVDQSLESLTGSPEVFRGDVGTLYGLGSAFTVNVQQLADQGTPVATIAPVIAQAWLQSQPGDWKIVVVGRENFVGSYGVPYTKLTYFVVKDGRLLDSRFYSPPQTSIETAFHNTSSLPPLYQGPQGRPASHTFSLYLGPSFTSTLTSQQGQSLLTSLQTAWAQYLSASDVKIEYLRPVKVMTSNGEMVTRLDYFVVAEGVLQNPMSVRAPGDDVLTRFSVPVCQACRPNPIQPISVEGQVTWSQANQIASDFLGSQNTAGGTNFQREEYVDSNGVPVTRLTLYGPSAPSGALGSGVVVSRLPLRRIYSLDLSGVVTSDRMSAVQEAIRRAWIVNNPRIDQNDISVQVIEMNSSYTDDQNNPVTRVRYTVTAGGADSSLTYGEEPLPSMLSGPLANVGVLLCNCVARQGRVVYVVGTVSQTDRPRLQSAILEAWRAANPAYANQITVDVVNTSTTTLQPSGQQVSWIWYVVEFQSGDLGQTDRDLTPPSQSDLTNRIALTGYVVTSAPPTQATPTSPTVTPTFTVRPPVGGVTDVMTTSAPASSNSVTEEVLLTGGATDLPWGVVQEVLRQSLNQTDPANAGRHRLDIIDRRIYVQPNGSVVVSYVYRRSPGNPLPGGQGRFWTVVSQGLASRGSSAQVYSAPVSGLYNVISAYSLDVQGPLSNTDLVANLSQFIARTWSENEPDCRCDWGVIVVGIDEYVGQYGTQYSRLTYFVVRDGSVVDARAVPQPQVLLQESLANQPRLPPPYIGRGGNPVQDSYTLMLSPGAPSRITSPAGVDVLNNLQAAWQAHLPGSNVRIEYAKPTQQFTINGETVTVLTYFVFVNGVRVNPRVTIAPTVNTLNDFRVPACRACVLAPVIPPVNVRGNVTRNEAFEIARDVLGPQVIGFSPTDLKTDQYLDSDGNWVTRVTLYSVRDAVGTPGSGVTIAVAPFTRVYYVDIEGAVGQDRVTTLAEILRRAWVQTNPKINSTDIEVAIRQMDPTFFSERNTPVTRVWYTVTVGGADSSLTYGEEPLPPTLTTLLGEVGLYLCGCLPRKSREIVITGEVTPEKTDVIKEAIVNTWREANPDFKGNVTVEITNIDNSGRDTNGRPLGRLWYVVWAEGVAGRQETDDLTPPTQTELTNRVVEAESSTSTPSPTPRPPSVLYIQEEVLLRGANASAVPWERVEEKLRQALNITDPGNACCVTLDVVGSQVFVDANGSVVIGYTYRRSPNNTLPGGQQRFLDNVDRVLVAEGVSTLPTTPPPALLNVTSAFTLTVQSDPGATLPSAETATAIARGWSASDPNCRCSWRVVIVGSDSYLGDFGTPYNNLTYFVVRDGRVLDSKNSTQPVELIRAELARRPDLPDLYPGQPGLPTSHTFSLITAPDSPRTLTSPEGQQLLTSLEAAWKTFLRDPNVKIQPLKPTPGTTSEGDKVAKWDYFVLVNGSALDPRTNPQPTDNFLQLLGVPVCQGCFVTYIPPIDVAGNVTWAAANDIATTVLKDPGPGKRNPEFEQERYIDNDGNPVTRIVLYSPVEDTNPLPPQVTVAKPPLRQLYYMDVQGVLSNDLNTQVALVYAIRRAWASNNPGVPLANISAEVHDMDSNYFDEKGGPVTRVWYTVAVGAADSSVTNAEEPQSSTLRDALKDGGLILCQCHPRPGRQLVVQGQISPNSSSTLADVIASQWRQANPGFQGNVTAQIVSIQNETGPNGERRGRVWYMLWVEGLAGRTGEEELSNLTPPTTTQLEDRLSQVVASVTSSTAPPTPRTTYTPSRATVTPSVAPGSASTLETIYVTGNMSGKSQQELQDILGRALNQTDPGNAKGLEVVGTSVFADANGNVVWAYTVRRYPGTPLPGGQEAYLDQVDQALQDSQTGGATYRGTVATLYGPSSAFRLRMPGLPGQQMDLPVVATALQEAWRLSDPNCNCEWRVIIVGSEPYVGQYGTQYQQLTYYVVKDGQLVDARVTQAPVDKVQEALAARPPLPRPLTSSQGSPLSHRYSLLLAPGAAERITSAQGRIVLNSLQQSWQSYLQSPVRIDYMKPVQVMTTNGERVTRLDYFVEANGRLLDPLANPAPSPSFFVQRGVPLCQQCVAPSSQPINVQGQITWSQADAIVKEVLGDSYSDMYGDTFSREMFVDSNGHPVTQLRVFSVTSPTRAPGEQVALAVPPLHRVYYVDLQGVVGQERTTAVSEAIRRAWARTNPTIPMYDLQLNNVTLDSKYFNERREPVTRVLYTVAVGGADSSLTNAEEPLPGEIAGALEEGGLSACGCRASRGQRLLVVGEVDPQDTASLKEAITKAWREANPDFKGNLTAEILEVDKNATGVNGENLDALTYVLGLEGMPRGQSESDLTDPSLDQLDAGLGSENTGVTVYRPPSDQGSQGTQWWVILLAILLALLFLLIVIIAVYFILRHFRNRDSRNLKQRPEEIEGFDKEHFSKEPTFNNPTYAGHSANYSQHRTYVVNVDE